MSWLFILCAILGGTAALVVLGFAWLVVRAARESRAFARLTDTHDLEARIDAWAAEYVAPRQNVWLVVGIWQRGRRLVRGYGRVRPGPAGTPEGKLIYEIGSVTKVFTGVLLALRESEGAVSLEDPVSRFLPASVAVPAPVACVTLGQLATHTSGLPRLPDNLDAAVRDEANPYAHYTAAELHAYLTGARLERAPGRRAVYSNLGLGLLGYLLTLQAAESFDELVQRDLCAPLGMKDTTLTLSPEQRPRLVPIHSPNGERVPVWDFDVLAPAGGLRSTADDLLTFLEANLTPGTGPLEKALARARSPHHRGWLGTSQGLGWLLEHDATRNLTLCWHNGGTGGSVSFLGLEENHSVGIVLLANQGDALVGDDSLDQLGLRLLRTACKVSLG